MFAYGAPINGKLAELQDLQQYYVSWSANNGVIVSLIEHDDAEFMRWVQTIVN